MRYRRGWVSIPHRLSLIEAPQLRDSGAKARGAIDGERQRVLPLTGDPPGGTDASALSRMAVDCADCPAAGMGEGVRKSGDPTPGGGDCDHASPIPAAG